jgi:hypothetical protein
MPRSLNKTEERIRQEISRLAAQIHDLEVKKLAFEEILKKDEPVNQKQAKQHPTINLAATMKAELESHRGTWVNLEELIAAIRRQAGQDFTPNRKSLQAQLNAWAANKSVKKHELKENTYMIE